MSDIRKNKGKNSGQLAVSSLQEKTRVDVRYQISDVRKDKGKETAKEENIKAFKCIWVYAVCIY
ncbi:MAG: hypothetical protein C0604_06090 [Clostridiales bacterium]|nr:MAG: hypothetical protein C0604_06090 [Clostridiales bacterium]